MGAGTGTANIPRHRHRRLRRRRRPHIIIRIHTEHISDLVVGEWRTGCSHLEYLQLEPGRRRRRVSEQQ